jgi:hypothetical protein
MSYRKKEIIESSKNKVYSMAYPTIKILIAGDSFAAPCPGETSGWPNLLSNIYNVKNIAQAGIGEYKILKQIQSENLNQYDLVIVSHTSPSRIHIKTHPIHSNDLHKNCDLIFTDIENRNHWFDRRILAAKLFFKHIFDDDYQTDIYSLMRQEINRLITIPYIAIGHIPVVADLKIEKNFIDFSPNWPLYKGDINHYNILGNREVCETLRKGVEHVLQQ